MQAQIIRRKVLEAYKVDRFTASQVAEQLSKAVFDVSDLTVSRIAGAIVSLWRHKRTGYEKELQGVGQHYYGSARKDIQQSVNEPLRAKLEALRVRQ